MSVVIPSEPYRAYRLVEEQLDLFNARGSDLLGSATDLLDQVASFALASQQVNVRGPGSPYGNVTAQLLPVSAANLAANAGIDPALFNMQYLEEVLVPELELAAPKKPDTPGGEPDEPPDPGAPPPRTEPKFRGLDPVNKPILDILTVPQYEDYTAGRIPLPVLRDIQLPRVPVIDIDSIQFTATPPTYQGPELDIRDFDFVNGTYSPLLVDEIKATILRMMNGESGLPAEVENALYERAREREEETIERDVQQVEQDWASRGFKYPSGVLFSRTERVRSEGRKRKSELLRTQFIEHWRIQIEQLRFAITSGIQLEELWLRLFLSAEDRRLQAARFRLDLGISVVNAYVSRLNAEAIVFQTNASVYRERIQAEVAKVQLYAEQLRAAQIINELNETDVRIYTEQIRALLANVEIFRTFVAAYTAQIEAQNAQIGLYRSELQANTDKVNVFDAEVRAFSNLIQSDNAKNERFRTLAQIYGTKADVWKTKYDVNRDQFNAEVEIERLKRDVFVANLERVRNILDSERTRVTLLLEKYRTDAQLAEIASRIDITEGELKVREYLATLEQAKAAADIALKNGEINIQSGLQAANIMLRAKETAATAYAQLAAGIASAAGVQASISGSAGYTVGFSGDIEQP